uniref:hypothetical protein n=1 Tax=Providencia sp. PROV009 TaxID=2949747 RepID=UPI00234BBE09
SILKYVTQGAERSQHRHRVKYDEYLSIKKYHLSNLNILILLITNFKHHSLFAIFLMVSHGAGVTGKKPW